MECTACGGPVRPEAGLYVCQACGLGHDRCLIATSIMLGSPDISVCKNSWPKAEGRALDLFNMHPSEKAYKQPDCFVR